MALESIRPGASGLSRDNPYIGTIVSRPRRIEFEGGVYHVIARGNERRAIFRDAHDRQKYLDRLGVYSERLEFLVHAYCLMPNHIHLALRTGRVPLSRIMLALHGSYAQDFNRRHQRIGHLFQGRYKAFLVEADAYLACLVRYIHLNPVKAKLATTAESFRWSSALAYRRGAGPAWLDSDFALRRFGRTRRQAIPAYEAFLQGKEGPRYEDLDVRSGVIKGDGEFVVRMSRRFPDAQVRVPITVEDLGRLATEVFGLNRNCLQSASSRIRGVTAYTGREIARIPLCHAARLFSRHETTIVKDVRRVEMQFGQDPGLRGDLARMRRAVAGFRNSALTPLKRRRGHENAALAVLARSGIQR